MRLGVILLAGLVALVAGAAWRPAAVPAFLLVVLLGWVAARRARSTPYAPAGLAAITVVNEPASSPPASLPAAQVVAPPAPNRRALTGTTPFRLSGAGRVSVVGESHYQPALRRAATGRSSTGYAAAIPATAALIPEPDNKHDQNAVRVDIAGRPVGYLSRDIAEDYQDQLLELAQRGEFGWCEARITGGGDRYYGVYLLLAGPDDLIPITAPDGMTLLATVLSP